MVQVMVLVQVANAVLNMAIVGLQVTTVAQDASQNRERVMQVGIVLLILILKHRASPILVFLNKWKKKKKKKKKNNNLKIAFLKIIIY